MTDSLLDQALFDCRDGLLELGEGPVRRGFEARLGVLQRATWTLPLEPAAPEQVVRLARAVLDLRDEILRALAAPQGLERRSSCG